MKGSIQKRGEKSWRIAVYLGINSQGKKEYYRETFHGTKKEAERRAAELVNQVNNRTFIKPAQITLGEFLQRWLEEYVRHSVRPATYDMYEMLVRVRIAPALGQVRLDELSPLDLQRFYRQIVEGPRADGKPGQLASTTVKHIHSVLRAALRRAVKWQVLARSPAEVVDPPRAQKKPLRVWTPDEAARFLEFVQDDRYYAAYLLAIGAGLRRGEILGLRWQDVDPINHAVIVNQSVVPTTAGNLIQEPKTAGSRRVVLISERTIEALTRRIASIQKERADYESIYGEGSYTDLGLIFPGVGGRPLNPSAFTRRFGHLAEKTGLPKIRFHDLRHTHATLMLQAGVHVKVMSERLGHSSISTTMNTYAHVLPTMQREVAHTVDRLLGLTEKGDALVN